MAFKSFRDRSPIAVGLVSLTVIAAMLVVTFLTGTMGLLKNRYEMSGIFSDEGGLRSGEDVKVAGVRVGEVTGVEPDFKRGLVVVTWKVDHGVDLGPQTRAEIRMSNILGGRYLRLTGPVTTPYMERLPRSRRRIPLARTQTPITVNEVLKEGTTALQGLDTKTLSKVIDQLGTLSTDNSKKLSSALSHLVELADEVNGSQDKVSELLDNSDRVLRIVKEKDAALSRLVDNALVLLDVLRQRRTQLALLLGSGSSAVKNASQLISTQQQQLDSIAGDLQHMMGQLNPQVGDLNRVLALAGPTVGGFNDTALYGNFADAVFSQLGQLSPTDLGKLAMMLKGAKK